MARLGIIDIGSNSIKSLVVRTQADGRICSESEGRSPTRIGTGLSDSPPQIHAADVTAAGAAIRQLMAQAHEEAPPASGAIPFRLYATSAIREASNRSEVAATLARQCEAPLTVLSGEEEATLIGWAARSMPELAAVPELLIADLGGGSLELIHIKGSTILQTCSLHLGAVRLNTKFFNGGLLPVSAIEQAALQAHINDVLASSGFDFAAASHALFVGSGGALSALYYMDCFVHREGRFGALPLMPVAAIGDLYAEACKKDVAARIADNGFPKNRADIMPAALLVLLSLARCSAATDYAYCAHNLRFGIAAQAMYEQQNAKRWQPGEPLPVVTIHS